MEPVLNAGPIAHGSVQNEKLFPASILRIFACLKVGLISYHNFDLWLFLLDLGLRVSFFKS